MYILLLMDQTQENIIRTKSPSHSTTIRLISKDADKTHLALSQQVSNLAQCIKMLNSKIEMLTDKKNQKQICKANIEERFMPIESEIPFISNLTQKNGQKKLLGWLGQLARTVFSRSFKLYEDGTLNRKKMRSFCSENMIFNLMEMIRINKLSASEIKCMSECFQNDIAPYLIYKYPKSEETEVNLRLEDLVRKVDNYDDNNNDFIFMSGIKFEYSQTGEYYSQIMRLLNHLFELPNKKEKILEQIYENSFKEEKEIPLGQLFQRDMNSLFRNVYSQKFVKQMCDFNLKQLIEEEQKIIAEGILSKASLLRKDLLMSKVLSKKQEELRNTQPFKQREKKEEIKQQYFQKVNSYTKYKIGRKTSENTKKFTERQIEEGKFHINSKIMRILVKWCEELEQNFDQESILNREEPFRMLDGSEGFLKENEFKVFMNYLKEQKKKIQQIKKKLLENSYEQQELLSMEKFQKQFPHLPEFDSKVGLFSSKMIKNYKYYIIKYVNALVHGLLSAQKEFMKTRNKQWNYKQSIPQLVTFKVGDLLRCSIKSKQNQIIALYNEIERINHYYPNILRIVKIKNKLETQTKNILIILMYRNQMMVQIQLGIDSQRSNFIECSDDFNHFIYELQRTPFGLFSQFCNIWTSSDPRADFYAKKQKQNQHQPQFRDKKHGCKSQWKQITLPFKCNTCSNYYSKLHITRNHKFCLNCRKNICIHCQISYTNSYEEMREIFPNLPEGSNFQTLKRQQIEKRIIPEFGIAVSLQYKSKSLKYFKSITEKRKKLVMAVKADGYDNSYHVLENISKISDQKNFFRKYAIIKIKNSEKIQKVKKMTKKTLSHEYFINYQVKKYVEKQKTSFVLKNESICDEILKKIKEKQEGFRHVKKINLMDNSLADFSLVAKTFYNVERVFLNNNKIRQIPDHSSKLKKIKYLYLENNQIESILPDIGNLYELKVLFLNRNKNLQSLPEDICDCEKLQQLYINFTSISSLPERINEMPNFRVLQGQQIKLQEFPQQLCECQKIQRINLWDSQLKEFHLEDLKLYNIIELKLGYTKIRSLPESLGNCKKLKILNLYECQELRKLPEGIGKCQSIMNIHLNNTSNLTSLPNGFKKLRSLKYLDITKSGLQKMSSMKEFENLQTFCANQTKLENLPEDISFCTQLEQVSLKNSPISDFPNLFWLENKLKLFYFSQTNISSLPSFLDNLNDLQHLGFPKIKIQALPEWFAQYPKLQSLDVSHLSLTKLPNNFRKLPSLSVLNLSNNRFEEFPHELLSLVKLQKLDLSQNEIMEIPEQIQEMKGLKYLLLQSNKFEKMPNKLTKLQNLHLLRVDDKVEVPYKKNLYIDRSYKQKLQ